MRRLLRRKRYLEMACGVCSDARTDSSLRIRPFSRAARPTGDLSNGTQVIREMRDAARHACQLMLRQLAWCCELCCPVTDFLGEAGAYLTPLRIGD